MYPAWFDWTRLMDFAKKVETRSARSESCGPILCQEAWPSGWTISSGVYELPSDVRSLSLPATRIDFTGGKTLVSTLTDKELNRK